MYGPVAQTAECSGLISRFRKLTPLVQIQSGPPKKDKYSTMEQKKPVAQYYYSEEEWARLGCGPLPKERDHACQAQDVIVLANSKIDNNVVKGSTWYSKYFNKGSKQHGNR